MSPVDLEAAFVHGVDDDGICEQDLDAGAHVQLDHLEPALGFVQRVEQREVLLAEGAERHQPGVDQTELFVA